MLFLGLCDEFEYPRYFFLSSKTIFFFIKNKDVSAYCSHIFYMCTYMYVCICLCMCTEISAEHSAFQASLINATCNTYQSKFLHCPTYRPFFFCALFKQTHIHTYVHIHKYLHARAGTQNILVAIWLLTLLFSHLCVPSSIYAKKNNSTRLNNCSATHTDTHVCSISTHCIVLCANPRLTLGNPKILPKLQSGLAVVHKVTVNAFWHSKCTYVCDYVNMYVYVFILSTIFRLLYSI